LINAQVGFRTLNPSDHTELRDWGYSGFIRPNGITVDGKRLPDMMMHITHPNSGAGHSRGIGFQYGNNGFGLTTTRWDSQGVYQGEAKIYTSADKPTPADVGAVNKAGDTMTGALNINVSGSAGIRITRDAYPGINLESTSVADAKTKLIEVTSDGDLSFVTRNSSGANNGVVTLAKGKSGEIYHTGNKPVWADVGGNSVFDMTSSYTKVAGSRWLQCASDATGIIPDAASTTGRCNLGNSSWWFKAAHIATVTAKEVNIGIMTVKQVGNKMQFLV
jgi:hypothetical protein